MSDSPKIETVVAEARRGSPYIFPMETTDLIAALTEDRNFRLDPVGGEVFFEGKAISPIDALETFALRNPQLSGFRKIPFDGQILDGVKSRADLKTTTAKVEFVRKFGQEAFEALPQDAPDDLTKLPSSAIRKLPTVLRSRLVGLLGERGYGELLRRNESL